MLLTNLQTVVSNVACRLFWPLFPHLQNEEGKSSLPLMSWVYSGWCSGWFLGLSSSLCKHLISNITNCSSLFSAKFLQSAKASCTQTIEKQPPLYSTHRTTTKEKGPNTLCTKKMKPKPGKSNRRRLSTQSFGKAVTW